MCKLRHSNVFCQVSQKIGLISYHATVKGDIRADDSEMILFCFVFCINLDLKVTLPESNQKEHYGWGNKG
jgi:hypothetical protein